MEEIFDHDDVAQNLTLVPTEIGVEDISIGTAEKPNMVKLSKSLTPKMKGKYATLFTEFFDVFAWEYSDLKVYDKSIIQHTIPIKPNQKLFHQKIRRINPKMFPSIEKELNRLYKAAIIVPLHFSKWMSNLVLVRKKTGEIRLCIDFRNLNKLSLNENYPLPKMDYVLQMVVSSSRMYLLYGYSGYNQIFIHHDDQANTKFTTPWGIFIYAKMPFGLKNAGATFQQAMDVAFANGKDVFLVIYLDDITVLSQIDEDHLHHLRIFFQRCMKFGISLNPKKILFSMEEGKLLGHIISKYGIHIDPTIIEAIQQLDYPRNKKEIQSFNGKINLLRSCIPNLVEHLREITNMLKSDSEVNWSEDARKSFNQVKTALSCAPILINLDYTMDFIIFFICFLAHIGCCSNAEKTKKQSSQLHFSAKP